MDQNIPSFWSIKTTELLSKLEVTAKGLTTDEAKKRLASYGANSLKQKKTIGDICSFNRSV